MKTTKERLFFVVMTTMKRWGFNTRMTLHNETGVDMDVDLLVRRADGTPIKRVDAIARLANNTVVFHEARDLLAKMGLPDTKEDLVFNFYLIPEAYRHAQGPIEVEREEMSRFMKAQDHYVEHYDPKSMFSSGVLYQTPPMNDPMIVPRSSFLLQAPKVFLTEHRNTVVQVMHWSSDPDFRTPGTARFGLRAHDGTRIHAWEQTIPAHGRAYVDVKEALARASIDWRDVAGRHGFLFLDGACADHAFVPITVNINETLGTFDMEHSLPPTYYGKGIVGPRKGQVIGAALRSLAPQQAPTPSRTSTR